MHSDRIPESTKQWLQNEDFILWCLAPTQESEEWWVNYQKEHLFTSVPIIMVTGGLSP